MIRDEAATPAQAAAADLSARIVMQAVLGPLAGLRCDVQPEEATNLNPARVIVTILDLPPSAVAITDHGIGPCSEGARMTALLAALAERACGEAGLRRMALLRIHPQALARAAAKHPQRRAS